MLASDIAFGNRVPTLEEIEARFLTLLTRWTRWTGLNEFFRLIIKPFFMRLSDIFVQTPHFARPCASGFEIRVHLRF